MDFFAYKNQFKPERGRLLISEPFLPDPNFERTVVLLCEHNEEGSFGFVINKPSALTPGEVVEDFQSFSGVIYLGGPVQQDTLHIIHRNQTLERAVQLKDNIAWGGDYEELLEKANLGTLHQPDVRFYLGYSGWGPGQLESELEADSWIVSHMVTETLLFDTPAEEIWRSALESLGGRFTVYSRYPVDPRLN